MAVAGQYPRGPGTATLEEAPGAGRPEPPDRSRPELVRHTVALDAGCSLSAIPARAMSDTDMDESFSDIGLPSVNS